VICKKLKVTLFNETVVESSKDLADPISVQIISCATVGKKKILCDRSKYNLNLKFSKIKVHAPFFKCVILILLIWTFFLVFILSRSLCDSIARQRCATPVRVSLSACLQI
jgi:hypothetical protein